MSRLAVEATAAQFPLIDHAEAAGWTVASDTVALSKRRGEEGLFFYAELEAALLRLNPGIVTEDNVQAVIQRMESSPPTIEGNRELLRWLRGEQSIFVESEKRHRHVRLIDYENLANNVFQVTYEWRYRNPRKGNRADVMLLINGIPVAIVENKNPGDRDAMYKALVQLRRYELQTPEMLAAPQVFNITHVIEYFYGVTWNYNRNGVFNWKDERAGSYADLVKGFFEPTRFLQMLKEWILFYVKDDVLRKTVLRRHQTRAAQKVVDRCAEPSKKTGLVWHTQGSGKTFTMLTAARLILEDKARFPGATVMLIVDRNELEGQLSGWVERLLGEMQNRDIAVARADSKVRLQELLDQDFRGLIVSMIHKFDGMRKESCVRSDFFVLIDEAHRSTGGDLGNYLMGALPNATLIGFTGTPVDLTAYGKGTFKVFGREDEQGYMDKYSIAESIADGTTLKLEHTLAPAEITLDKEVLEKEFLSLRETEGISDIDELNRILERAVTLRTVLKSEERVDKVAQFIAKHFRENVAPLGYKAFLVAVDREACALYKRALDKYLPGDLSRPVYTPNANDVVERPLVAELQLGETDEKNVRKLFVKPDEQPQILIVTDKLLTGYDAPILYCMYLDKPMRDHVLLQAIARVNRPYEDESGRRKPCGLIVDFIGVLRELNKALAFDSKDVSGVIEDLDLLMARFVELMQGPAQRYLRPLEGGKDEHIEHLLATELLDKTQRDKFVELYKELESLYEILSPSPELRGYMDGYRRLADLYAIMRAASSRATFYEDVARKTEMLVRETAGSYAPLTGSVAVFDEQALEALKKRKGPDVGKIMNLVRGLRDAAAKEGEEKPYLATISERADAILQALEEKRTSTEQALRQLEMLMQERLDAEEERRRLGLDAHAYAVYLKLKELQISGPEELTKKISACFTRFPNYAVNDEELRRLKADMYKILLIEVGRQRMVDLTDEILNIYGL